MAVNRLFTGVDGGGTKCRVRIRDADGALLGEAVGGLANLYQDSQAAIATILETIAEAMVKAKLRPEERQHMHVGLGLAGAVTVETVTAYLRDLGR